MDTFVVVNFYHFTTLEKNPEGHISVETRTQILAKKLVPQNSRNLVHVLTKISENSLPF